jgi:hypothetical protein
MSDNISSTTKVYVFFFHPQSGARIWVTGVENKFDKQQNRLVLFPKMVDSPSDGVPSFSYEYAIRMRDRFREELPAQYDAHFSLDPTGPEVGVSAGSASGGDNRVPMAYRNLIATPGYDVNEGRVWFCKFPGTAIQSIRGSSPEQCIDRCYEMNLQAQAQQAPPPPAPEVKQEVKIPGPRQRPGDLR